jgi:NAD(P)H dehydrogenase (quinone)
LGRTIRYEPESVDQFDARLTAIGLPGHFIQHIVAARHDYQDGKFSGTNDVVVTLTGKRPLSIGEYVRATIKLFQPTEK